MASHSLQATAPAVEGDWGIADTAEARYTEWVGLYGTNPTVEIRLIEVTDGREHLSSLWTAQGEVKYPMSPSAQ
nr:hypothetical protein [Streptomyces antibioticus]